MNFLRRIASLNNLKNANPKSQVATILILVIVAVLVFILTMVNTGGISSEVMLVANAADAASLSMASQLASYANLLVDELGDTEQCVKGGLLPVVLAIIGTIILNIIIPGGGGFLGMSLWQSVLGGFIGGAIGGGIVQGNLKGAIMGGLQGAAIGAAIFGGVQAGASLVNGSAFLEVAGCGVELAMTPTITAVAVAGGALSAGAALYNAAVRERQLGDYYKSLANQMSGLPKYESLRETTFYDALSRCVDDSNEVVDSRDLDGDGDTTDMLSAFAYWWDDHIRQVKAGVSDGAGVIEDFIEADFIPFYEGALEFLKYMDRQEIECGCTGAESELLQLVRALEACNYPINFFEPGPTASELLSYYSCTSPIFCGGSIPPGFDSLDKVRMELEEFIDWARELLKEDPDCGYLYEPAELDDDHDWIDKLYRPGSSSRDFYEILDMIAHGQDQVRGIEDWAGDINTVFNQLPGCQLTTGSYNDNGPGVRLAAPACQEYPPLYPCNWERSPVNNVIGPHFPNPVCKLNAGNQATLRAEINNVQTFLTNINQNIINTHFQQPCAQLGDPIGTTYTLLTPITINASSVCLDGNMHPRCSRDNLSLSELGTIRYQYTYSYSCRACFPGGCSGLPGTKVTPPAPASPYCTCGGSCCSSTYNAGTDTCSNCTSNNNCCTSIVRNYAGSQVNNFTAEKGDRQPIRASDLSAPCSTVAGLSSTMTQYRNFITNLTPDPNRFVSIDKDSTDEFYPVFDALTAEVDAIDDFLRAVRRFRNRMNSLPGTRAQDAAGSVRYDWEDNLEMHRVIVETGPATFAKFEYTEDDSFFGLIEEKCVIVDDRTDRDRCWVRITREDWNKNRARTSANAAERDMPSAGTVDLGWKWNPGLRKRFSRLSRAGYDWDDVRVKAIRW